MEERKTVVVRIDSNDPGTVIDIANILKRKRLPPKCKVTPDMDRWTVTVEGTDKKTVEIAMAKYAKGFSDGAGHGGYRLKYEIEEVVVSEKEVLKKQFKGEYESENAGLKRRLADLGEKWGKERKALVDALAGQERELKQLRKALDRTGAERGSAQSRFVIASGELSETRRENEEFRHQREAAQRTPLHKVVFRRLVRFVRRWSNLRLGRPEQPLLSPARLSVGYLESPPLWRRILLVLLSYRDSWQSSNTVTLQ